MLDASRQNAKFFLPSFGDTLGTRLIFQTDWGGVVRYTIYHGNKQSCTLLSYHDLASQAVKSSRLRQKSDADHEHTSMKLAKAENDFTQHFRANRCLERQRHRNQLTPAWAPNHTGVQQTRPESKNVIKCVWSACSEISSGPLFGKSSYTCTSLKLHEVFDPL